MGLNSRAKLIADGFDADKVAHRMYLLLVFSNHETTI